MRWLLLTTCVIAGLGAWSAAPRSQPLIQPPGSPICRRAEVVDVVRRDLQRRVAYAQLDWASIGEEPTAESDVVRCGVCLNVALFDTPRSGLTPVQTCQRHTYEVQNLRAGFVVLSID